MTTEPVRDSLEVTPSEAVLLHAEHFARFERQVRNALLFLFFGAAAAVPVPFMIPQVLREPDAPGLLSVTLMGLVAIGFLIAAIRALFRWNPERPAE